MQIGFKVWQDASIGKDINELYYSFYIFYMIGSCFIVLKVKIIINFIFDKYRSKIYFHL